MLARKSLLHFANTVLGAVMGAVALKAVALYMGDEILGSVAYAMGLVGLVSILMQFSLPQAHTKRMSEGHRPEDGLATYLWTQTFLVLLFLAGVAGFVGFRLFVQGKTFHSTTALTILIMGVYWSTKSFQDLAMATFNARREIARNQATEFVHNLVRTGLTVVAAVLYAAVAHDGGPLAGVLDASWWWVEAYGPELLALTYVAGGLGGNIVGAYYLHRDYPVGRFDPAMLRNYWDFARPLFLVTILGVIANKIDRVTLGYFWGRTEVGLYYGVYQITAIVQSIAFAMSALLLPTISSLSVDGEEERVGGLVHRSHRYTTMVVLPLVLFLVVFARPVIHLVLSDDFLSAAPTLAVLSVYALVFVAYRPFVTLLTGMDRPELAARIGFTSAATNIVLNLILVPADIRVLGLELFGLAELGAALATLSSALVGYVLARMVAGQVAPLEPELPHVARQLLAGLTMTLALLGLNELVVGLARWYHLLLFGVVGGLVYLASLVLVRGFTREDLEFFLDILHPLEMLQYIREELFGSSNGD